MGTTEPNVSDKVRAGLPGDKGLKIIPVPGGMYKVKNLAGGVSPAPLGGLHTDLGMLHRVVLEYNTKVSQGIATKSKKG